MKKFLALFLLFSVAMVPNITFGNIKFTKDESAILAESFKKTFGDKADAALDTFKDRYDEDKGIDADGMAAVFASGTDSKENSGFNLKKFWTDIVDKVASVFVQKTSACKSSVFEKNCNRDFKAFNNYFIQNHQFLVDLYAQTHNLSCSFDKVETDTDGTVRAICSGDDVMVFEFSSDSTDISSKDAVKIFCIASNGKLSESGDSCESKFCDNKNLKVIVTEIDAKAFRARKKGLRLSENKNGSCKLKVHDAWAELEPYGADLYY